MALPVYVRFRSLLRSLLIFHTFMLLSYVIVRLTNQFHCTFPLIEECSTDDICEPTIWSCLSKGMGAFLKEILFKYTLLKNNLRCTLDYSVLLSEFYSDHIYGSHILSHLLMCFSFFTKFITIKHHILIFICLAFQTPSSLAISFPSYKLPKGRDILSSSFYHQHLTHHSEYKKYLQRE